MDFISNFTSAFLFTVAILSIPSGLSYLIIIIWMKHLTRDDAVIKEMHGRTEFVRYIFTIDTNKGLSSQGLFWMSILVPFVYFFVVGMLGWKDYKLRLDAEGFKTFISISALPIGILSLAVPLSAIVARFHTSKQTARQIEIVSQKNNVDLFHAHRREFFSYFSQVGETKYSDRLTGKNYIHPRLHKILFKGKPEHGSPKPNEAVFKEISRDIHSLKSLLDDVLKNKNKERSFDSYLANFCPQLYGLTLRLGLIEIYDSLKEFSLESLGPKNEKKYLTVGGNADDAVHSLRYIDNFFSNLCDFAGLDIKKQDCDIEFSYFMSNNQYKHLKPDVVKEIITSMNRDINLARETNTPVIIN